MANAYFPFTRVFDTIWTTQKILHVYQALTVSSGFTARLLGVTLKFLEWGEQTDTQTYAMAIS
jgi:hypothetical protein